MNKFRLEIQWKVCGNYSSHNSFPVEMERKYFAKTIKEKLTKNNNI